MATIQIKDVKQSHEKGLVLTELHINGEFVAGWKQFKIPPNILHQVKDMIAMGVDQGERIRAKKIKELLA